ncbi:ABC transporter permease [Nocardia vermiculata]|uniref:Transport permease protein n=1 Tax=Nocardia vermiculata TaxID=257274 RepID=A0A846Y6M5_9NOCA|nr:ABC transporter permease [Nocardia vermiculata]NKY53542.1 ABC transporter permease [Nocardia vermiculata]
MTRVVADSVPVVRGDTERWRYLVPQTVVQTQRLLRRWRRDPVTTAQTLGFPALLLVVLNTVLGRQISAFSGVDALYGTVPMVAVVSAMTGSLAGAVTLGRERDSGLLARLSVLPVHRASGPLSRILAEVIRIVVCTAVLFAIGTALGFRFHRPLAALAVLGVPVVYGLGFATMVTAVAVYSARTFVVEAVSLGSALLMFFSSGFVPPQAYPDWARPLVQHQPMSAAVDAMRALALGEPAGSALAATLAWSVGAMLVFAVPAAIGFRRADRR